MLVDQLVELGGINVSSTWHNDILSNVELVVELFNLFRGNWVGVLSDTGAGLSQVMVPESSVVNVLKGGVVWVHTGWVLINGRFKGLDLDWLESGFQDHFWQKANCLAQLAFIEEQSESADFSFNVDFEIAAELVNPFFDLLFGVGLGSSEGALSNELRDRAVFESLLSAADLDVDGDGSLVAGPVLGSDSNSIGEFVESGGPGGLEGFRDLSPW